MDAFISHYCLPLWSYYEYVRDVPNFDEHGKVTNLSRFISTPYLFTDKSFGDIDKVGLHILTDSELEHILNRSRVIWYIVISDHDLLRGRLEKYLVEALIVDTEKILHGMIIHLKIDFFKNTFTNDVGERILLHNWENRFTLIPLLKVFNSDYFDTKRFKKLLLKDGKVSEIS